MNRHIAASVGAVLLCVACQTSPASAQALPDCGSHGLTNVAPANSHVPTEDSYPLLSAALGEEGTTVLQFDVGADGTVKNSIVAKSSGSLRLDDAAVTLAKGWLYKPALLNGKPMACRFSAAVQWRMYDSSRSDDMAS